MSNLQDAVVDYLLYCRSRNLSDKTVAWYEYKLRFFAAWCDQHRLTEVEDITLRHYQQYLVELNGTESYRGIGKKRSSYTTKGFAQVIKGFLRWGVREEMVQEKLLPKLDMPKVSKRLIKTFTPEMLQRLDAAASNESHPWLRARDLAILHLLLDTGMRASELCTLRPDSLHLDPDDPYVCVVGKGDKERYIGPLAPETQMLLRRYLRTRPKVKSDTLILSTHHEPLTVWGLGKLIERLERWAGEQHFTGVRVSPHTFRHTFAVNKLREGMDLVRLSLLLGHNSLGVTENYLRDFRQQEARFTPATQQPGRRKSYA